MRTLEHNVDLCVIGGGMSGLCAAISAARHGVKTLIMQDRPVFGGNASSEIRMHICGCHGDNNRETGILEEIVLDNFYRNENLSFSAWDGVLYGKAIVEENLKTLFNTSCLEADCKDGHINSVKGWQLNTETYHIVKAKYFADCSGDSILAPLTGAKFMYGREAKAQFDERIPPDVADSHTMGMSCLLMGRETDHKVIYHAPEWAKKFTDLDLKHKGCGRDTNFWWIETGGMGDCIHDSDECRDDLVKIAYGVWDYVKNVQSKGAFDNFELEWIGFLPGKRESRRYVGDYIINQNDVEAEGRFDDMVAYAGWTMDDHFPQGFYYTEGHPTIYHPAPTPWGIPWRSLYSANIDNLLFAGRNISVTHAALSSSRVMGTCAILGQAVGTGVSVMLEDNTNARDVDVTKIQQRLMQDDCYIPWHEKKISELCKNAKVSDEIVRNGKWRGDENLWTGKNGDVLEYSFKVPEKVNSVTLVFDSNLNRPFHNMPSNYYLNEQRFKMPKTLIKDYNVEYTLEDGTVKTAEFTDNHRRFVKHDIGEKVKSVRFVPKTTWGNEEFRVFGFEVE